MKNLLKKTLSILLCLTFVLTALAGCKDDVSVDESSSAESAVSESGDESSKAESLYLGDEVGTPEYKTLISAGKVYKTSETPSAQYPDIYNAELTDGKKAPEESGDYNTSAYAGYHGSTVMSVTVDLGKVYENMYSFSVGYLATNSAGVRIPTNIRVMASNDGKKFEKLGNMEIPEFKEDTRQEATFVSDRYVNARYIRFAISKGGWFFADEVEIFADVDSSGDVDVYTETVAKDYETLGTVDFEGGNTPDETLPYALISSGCKYTLSRNTLDSFKDNGTILTDGIITGLLESGEWVGFDNSGDVSIVVDLGSKRDDLSFFRIPCFTNFVTGTKLPTSVTYAVSDDGESFTDIGRIFGVSTRAYSYDYPLSLAKCASGRYVRFTLKLAETDKLLIEEAAVYARSANVAGNSLFPKVVFDAEETPWESVSSKKQNLLQGLTQQIFIPADTSSVGSNISSHDVKVLTDGRFATVNDIHNGQFYKFCSTSAPIEFYFDLGTQGALSSFTMELTHLVSWGIAAPNSYSVYLSNDASEWYLAGEGAIEPKTDNEIVKAEIKLSKAIKARYICFRVMTASWFGCSELEAYGTTSVSGAKTPEEAGLVNRDEASLGYLAPDKDILNGIKDLCLIYHGYKRDNFDTEDFLPYVAYLDEEGNYTDTMFDSFLFLLTGTFPSNLSGHADCTKSDLDWTLTDLFTEGKNILALEEAAGIAKQKLGLPEDFKYGLTIALYQPSKTNTNFGDINGDGKSESTATPQDKVAIIKWYIDQFEAKYSEYDFKNIDFIGYYWYGEGIYPENGDVEVLKAISKDVHSRGVDFFWIPWYNAPGVNIWDEVGFDSACMQPNYVFDETVSDDRMKNAVNTILNYGMGIEIEIGGSALGNDTLYRRYVEYLAGGSEFGYMNNCIHMYYQEIDCYGKAALSKDAKIRYIYDITYEFIKGTLSTTPEKLETIKLTAKKNTVLDAVIAQDSEILCSYDCVVQPEAGSVSISKDGKLLFFPAKDFVGTVTVGYTYNEGMGESEICYIEITVE